MSITYQDQASSIPHSSSDWKDHEHVAQSVVTQAQQLVETSGSIELAKQAIDSAADSTQKTVTQHTDLPTAGDNQHQDCFAKAHGFEHFGELQSASETIASNDGQQWFLTPLGDGTWVAWTELQLHLDRHFASREEAEASVPHEAQFSGSSLLG